MKKLETYLEEITGESDLVSRDWKEIVDDVILPKLAGSLNSRWCINDMFMNFLAEYAEEVQARDAYLAGILFEIALQRLSCGAVVHTEEPTPWPEPLPEKYWNYSSKYDECHIMTAGCYNFIVKAIESCLNNSFTKGHALAILFGLVARITPNGDVDSSYYAMSNFESEAIKVFVQAKYLIEKYADFRHIYVHYARKGQWQKHRLWFFVNMEKLNWNKFFKDVQIGQSGSWLSRWKEKKVAKRQIRHCGLLIR